MPIHDFSSLFTQSNQEVGGQLQPPPIIDISPPAVAQLSDIQNGRVPILGQPTGTSTSYIEEFLIPGFHALDAAMKLYWSGIRVPTKDSYRFMRVKIAGGDKSLLCWADDLKMGRVRLPVASIDRTGHQWNKEKFSPPYLAMNRRYLSSRGDLAAKVYRPIPFLVNYKMTIWAEHKRDAEYILYQVSSRFNPLAEFRMSDSHIEGNVQLRDGSFTDSSEKETGFDQQAKIRYDYIMVAEAWLPLPEKVIPTILGKVTTVKESQTDTVLMVNNGRYTFIPAQ